MARRGVGSRGRPPPPPKLRSEINQEKHVHNTCEEPDYLTWFVKKTDPHEDSSLHETIFGARLVYLTLIQSRPSERHKKVIFIESVPTFTWRESGESHFGKNRLGTADRDSNRDLFFIASLVYCESSALDHAATKADILPYNLEGLPATREFLLKVTDILLDFVKETNDRDKKVLEFHHPADMWKLLDLEIPERGLTLQQLIDDCSKTLKYQVRTGHPRFFNQLSCGLDLVSMAGEWLTATANTNMFTYEIAPVFILMEHVVMEKMREVIGFKGGDSILAPGGSVSNLYAFLAARHKMFPYYKEKGLSSIPGQLVMYTSDQVRNIKNCHYSVKSCASVGGLGTDNCIEVPSDDRGRMIPEELERLVLERKSRGHIPFFVNATSGTTVLGAFDPLEPIADICQKYRMWLHVDAAWGGGLLLSRKYRHPRLTGIERADSVTWNPHKLMGTLLQCSTIHFKEDVSYDKISKIIFSVYYYYYYYYEVNISCI
uniref:Glutamate decarboxylase n=1 Tax=Timema tahoe TaxID=61484 RepID=A0A7R9IQN1_9NEOP|nr:unnamed protein product [Timema tahoe]